eukprot:scaffold21455_cov116-Cylindrotheca_fusiformis.AAC.5
MSPSSVTSVIASNLQSGPYGILALSAITWSVVLPLTLYKKMYGISVAYGFSVLAAGYAMLQVMSSSSQAAILMAQACMFYGARLGGYLLLRDVLRDSESKIKNGSIISRIIFSASLALFYGFLTTPVMYALRDTAAASTKASLGGAYLAWFGAALEAVADFHKLAVKQKQKKKDEGSFVGPTTLAYRICRHPNYLGEILFWMGIFVGGVPSFGKSIPAWAGSLMGLFGIVSIMYSAAAGLEEKQETKYGGQQNFDSWREDVKYSLIPFLF